MRAAVILDPGRLQVTDVPIPEPGEQEVRVRLEGSGVCASNLSVWQGQPWFTYPLVPGAPGHEGWGRIDAVGPGVSGLTVGERVAGLFSRAYAEYDIAPADTVIPLPAALGAQPFPGEPLGCAMNVFRRSEISSGQTVAIVGIGFLGALLTRLATKAGARVIAISRRPFALEIARSFGATETLALDSRQPVIDQIHALTGGRLCDRVIEAVGEQGPLDLAAELTRERGRLIIAGYHQDGPRQVNLQLWNWRGLDVINAHERAPEVYLSGMHAALEAVVAGTLDPSPLYTHLLPLDRLGEALDLTRDRPAGFLKALVRP